MIFDARLWLRNSVHSMSTTYSDSGRSLPNCHNGHLVLLLRPVGNFDIRIWRALSGSRKFGKLDCLCEPFDCVQSPWILQSPHAYRLGSSASSHGTLTLTNESEHTSTSGLYSNDDDVITQQVTHICLHFVIGEHQVRVLPTPNVDSSAFP